MLLSPNGAALSPMGAALSPEVVARLRGGVARWMIALVMLAGCSPADADRPPPTPDSVAERATDAAETNPMAGAEDAVTGVGGGSTGDGQAQDTPGSATGTATEAGAPAPECVPPVGTLASDASLEGRAGEYNLTMVEEVDGSPVRTAEGSLALLTQVDSLRRFAGTAGGAIPGVTSPLFGSTDLNVEAVGAVRVGDLSSEDPTAPGVLVIESETGTTPSILLRFGSDANRRDLVRFDGGYTVLRVVEIAVESFSGTWSSGARGPEAEGFFCATRSR